MKKHFCLTYIGYLIGYGYTDPVLLCVSDNKNKIKYYLKDVRGLSKSNYEIKEVVLDFDTAINLYEDYILQDFEEDCLFITNRDIEYINMEIQLIIQQLETSYTQMEIYCNIIKKIPDMKDHLNTLMTSLSLMEKHLTKVKTIRKICNSELKESPVFSKNILEYIKDMGYLQEDRELTEMFYRKVHDDT